MSIRRTLLEIPNNSTNMEAALYISLKEYNRNLPRLKIIKLPRATRN